MAISITATDADALKVMAALVGTGTGGAGGGTGTTPPSTTDTNVYPLKMPVPGSPTGGAPGANVDVGDPALPNTIVIQACTSNDGPANPRTDPNRMCQFAVVLDLGLATQKTLAGPLYVSASTGEDGGQIFRIHHAQGSNHTVSITPGGGGQQINDLWINGMQVDFVSAVYNGPPVQTPTPPGVNQVKVWNEFGNSTTWSTTLIPVAPPIPPPQAIIPSVVTGATINGAPAAPATLAALIAATPANGTLLLPAGSIFGSSRVGHPMTIQGTKDAAGNRLTIIDGAKGGIEPAGDKALLVPTVAGLVVRGLVMQGAAVSAALGGNAAAIRQDGTGYGFEVDDCEITGCQNGLLTFAGGPIIVSGCHIHGNGGGNPGGGATHEIYTGGGDGSAADLSALIITNTKIECGTLATHAVHNRCKTFHSTNCDYVGNGDDGTNGGSVIDVANGGDAQITGGTITIPASAGNRLLIQYGEDGMQPVAGSTLAITNVIANTNGGAGYINGVAGGTLEIVGGTFLGAVAPAPESWGTVKGAFAVGGAPGT